MGFRWVVITGNMGQRELVNEDSEDDEGYSSIAGLVSKTKQKRNEVREQDLRIEEEDSIEILSEKFSLLRAAYDKIGDEMTRVRYENESLKDHQEEREEEMKLQRREMLELAERLKVMQKERETDKTVILRQQEIIDKYAGQEMRDTESKD